MPNRLAKESSPYLLQHAENPVDWYPWGPEALAAARRRDVPILLSIGYSACHWCHVMERESFEDPQTAEVMNERFVNIKVDREERPDVDAIYMKAIQSLTGHGGWPLTAFLLPDGRPFFGGTYFPPLPRHGLPSFRHVLETTAEAYANRKDQVEEAAAQIHELLERASRESDPGTGEFAGEDGDVSELLDHAARSVSARFDMKHGGFGGAPKFPQSDVLELLLRHHLRTGKPRPLEMVVHTLKRMGRGGIYDQLGGGFHRYTVDAAWLVPHFEKMLYDNALLARLYVRTFQATEDDELRRIAEGTLDYVVRDLRAPEGGFYSARDADSEGEEGLFYLWERDEVVAALGRVDGELFCRLYDVSGGGNFEGRNILHVPHDPATVAESAGLTFEGLAERMDAARRTLFGIRAEREPPFRDDKILAGWNGLTIRAFAEAGAMLERPDYLEVARDGAAFILDAMRIDDRLLHSYKDGLSKIDGFLEDYGAVGQALLALHEATLESRWLEEALWVAERMIDLFWNEDESAFYDNARDAEELVVRPRDITDNATPSGNSLAVELLFRLGHLVSEPRWTDVATRVVRREAGSVERFPAAFGRLGSAMSWLVDAPQEIVVLGPPEASGTGELLAAAWSEPHNARVITGGAPGEAPRIPLLESRSLLSGSPTAYVCEQFTCRYPVVTPGQLAKLLRADRPNQEASSAAGQGSLP